MIPILLPDPVLCFPIELIWGVFKRRLGVKLAKRSHRDLLFNGNVSFRDVVAEELHTLANEEGFDGVRYANKAFAKMSAVLQGIML